MRRGKIFEFELTGGGHTEGNPGDGTFVEYKKGDIIETDIDLAAKFGRKFKKVSEGPIMNVSDFIIPGEGIKPPKDSEIHCIGKYKLSILICTIRGREHLLERLLSVLDPQCGKCVEVLIEKDSGRMSTGKKRNVLLEKAKGDYIAFIDDDDLISEDYMAKILWGLQENPDCCSLEGLLIREKTQLSFYHSIEYEEWFRKGDICYRCPNHLNAVKRELALKVKFPYQDKGEDCDYSLRLRPLLETESKTEGILYYYLKVKAWTKP